MAISLVQHGHISTTASGTTVAATVTATGAGNLIVVIPQFATGEGTATGVTDGTTAFTQAGTLTANNTGGRELTAWYLLSANAGKTTLTATRSGAADTDQRILFYFEFSGFTTAAYDVGAELDSQTAAGTLITGAAVTTTGTGCVVAAEINDTGTVSSSGGGFTFGDTNDYGNGSAYKLNTTAATYTPTFTSSASGENYGAITFSFKESSGGAAQVPYQPNYQMAPILAQ